MSTQSPYHEGERKVQLKAGESAIGERNGTVISELIIPGAIPFIAQQSMIVVSSLDNLGKVWASVIIGQPGFVFAPTASSIIIDLTRIISHKDDPFWTNIISNPKVGMLIIELSTRRRLRVNGSIEAIDEKTYQLNVEQAYPNCPKYIQRRSISFDNVSDRLLLPDPEHGRQLTHSQIQLIKNADSFFVGSASPLKDDMSKNVTSSRGVKVTHGADASHRGGHPGFVQIKSQVLKIPDYQGNSMFNTLGNIEIYPQAGFVFIDFENKKLLQLSGNAKVLWDQEDPTELSGGTQRFWELEVDKWIETELPESIDWQFFDYSPHNPREKKSAEKQTDNLRLEVAAVENKTDSVKLFRLVSQEKQILPAFEPGAHLPISLSLPNGKLIDRHYSLVSSSNENRFYEIAVQREDQGRGGSLYMHQQIQLGSFISAKPPRNEFPLVDHNGCTLLIAGGIGITPMISMIQDLKERNKLFELHYIAKTKSEMAFYKELKTLAGDNAYFYFSKEIDSRPLDIKAVMKSATNNTHIYVCGPVRMINDVKAVANQLEWDQSRVHFESFGASSQNNTSFQVRLARSDKAIRVKPNQSILDSLLEKDITVAYDCKRGECGMCSVTVLEGKVEHKDVYLSEAEKKDQMCLCVSRTSDKELVIDL